MNPRPNLLEQGRYMLIPEFGFAPGTPPDRISRNYSPLVLAATQGEDVTEQPAFGPLLLPAGKKEEEVPL